MDTMVFDMSRLNVLAICLLVFGKFFAGYLILLMIAKDNESNAIQQRIREKGSTPRNSEDSPQTHTGGEFEVQYI